MRITESQFADDAAVYATTREALEQAAGEFVNTAAEWGLTVSLEKTKLITMGKELEHEDSLPVQLASGEIAMVEDFTYLGSNISRDCEVKSEIVTRIGKASRAFGCLKAAWFQNSQLSTDIKREVYRAVVLSTLLYSAETWTVKAESVRKLSGFHNRCIRSMLGVSRIKQWKERITSKELAETFGITADMAEILRGHRLRWLGHIARMENSRLPKQLLFYELVRPRPRHGTKKRWRDVAVADLRVREIEEKWYEMVQDRKKWSRMCKQRNASKRGACASNLANPDQSNPSTTYSCLCGCHFRRKGDLTRHQKFCDGSQQPQSRRQPVSTYECPCGRTFRRQGDLTRHSRFRNTES